MTLAGETLRTLEASPFGALRFPPELEDLFEAETRKLRSFRMWAEGLIAIVGLNLCLILDYLFVRDISWLAVLRHTWIVTPIALATNLLVYRNPKRWLREGSVALATVMICIANLLAEGTRTATGIFFGVICVLITALFVGVVMRLRFPYMVVSIAAMLLSGLWALQHSPVLGASAAFVGGSLLVIGLGIIVMTSYSLERAERCGYLQKMEGERQAAELALSNQALQELSRQDKLTGLPNRLAFEEYFERLWIDGMATGKTLAAIMVDVDRFKQVNDRFGHLYGDETLQRVGQLITQALRSTEDMAARYGGEEFVILLAGAESTVAQAVAERARLLVETAGTPATANDVSANWITVSCGVSACIPGIGGKRMDLVAAADEALYTAKRTGRNRVVYQACKLSVRHGETEASEIR